MRAYQKGDSSAFEEIYARYSANVMAFLKKRVALRPDQEEIFQRVFLKFHRSRHGYNAQYPVLQWLYVITKSELLDHLKSQSLKSRLEDDLEQETVSQRQVSRSLNSMSTVREITGIEELDSIQREVISMRILEDASFSDIALKLKKSEANVRQILSRTLKKLRSRREDK